MNILDTKAGAYAVGIIIIAGIGYLIFKSVTNSEVVKTAKTLGSDLASADPQNIYNKKFEETVQGITGKESWTLGSWIGDLFPSDAEKQFNASQNIR